MYKGIDIYLNCTKFNYKKRILSVRMLQEVSIAIKSTLNRKPKHCRHVHETA